MTEMALSSFTVMNSVTKDKGYNKNCITLEDVSNDPNGFNFETIIALKESCEGKGLSRKFKTFDELLEDLNA